MDRVLKDIPELLRSVTDPFSLLALITLVLGFVAYFAIRKSPSVKAAGLPAPILSLCIVAASLLALGFNVIRVTLSKSNALPPAVRQFSLQVVFKGTLKHTSPITVPFSVSSGQLVSALANQM